MDDSISRRAAIGAVFESAVGKQMLAGHKDLITILKSLPSAQPEITDEQAIEHLQATGWMQNHDHEMYMMGKREGLADDSGSYDSLIPAQRWISVSERLPEDFQQVLVWYEYWHWKAEELKPEYGIGWRFRGLWCGDPGNGSRLRVIAWMPLPDPYKEEQDR